MLSFSKVVTFAAVAFGTLCQAVPLIPRDVSIRAPASGPVQLKGLLTEVKTQLTAAVVPIHHLTHDTATASAVIPILDSVNVILNDAAKLLDNLVGGPVDELLEDVNNVPLTVEDVFDLVSDVLTVVFEALQVIYEFVADISELVAILPTLFNTITALLKSITSITAVVFGNVLVLKLQVFVGSSLVAEVLKGLNLPYISL